MTVVRRVVVDHVDLLVHDLTVSQRFYLCFRCRWVGLGCA